jgi:asparagine synthase (glutamine-hydrolysing)
MCGIAGFYQHHVLPDMLYRVGKAMQTRGPDDFGTWQDANVPIAFVHQRLSILDTSRAGHQPMASSSGRFIMAYNGEIYNYRELNKLLKASGVVLNSSCDTETLLTCIETFGLDETLSKLNGMFAFSLWDRDRHKLYLVRDRIGIKPLYFSLRNNQLCFASDLSGLYASGLLDLSINTNALSNFLKHSYIASPKTIHNHVTKVKPGHVHVFSFVDNMLNHDSKAFWSFEQVIASRRNTQAIPDEATIHSLMSQSVAYRMISDVPIGSFLSGGIDSSLISALMQSHSSSPIKTFSIGFNNHNFNEAHWAKKVANHLGTDHTELYVSDNDLLDIIPTLSKTYHEPFADSSQIPTILLSRLAKQSVTVCLSGDGGDELFGGYNRYLLTEKIWHYLRYFPLPFRKMMALFLEKIPPKVIIHLLKTLQRLLRFEKIHNYNDKLPKLIQLLRCSQFSSCYKAIICNASYHDSLLLDSTISSQPGFDISLHQPLNYIEEMMLSDSVSYLPGDILTKVDRASMSTSLEVRVPLLDHRLVEAAWSLPFNEKVADGKGKLMMRKILKQYIPDEYIDRPKMGFGVPLAQWLRGPLNEWAGDLLSSERIKRQAIFNVKSIETMWDEHRNGHRDHHYMLWPILMFQDWFDHYIPNKFPFN